MAYVRDRWHRLVTLPDGTKQRQRSDRYGRPGKRWLAVWIDPATEREKTAAFAKKVDAETKASEMETDIARGEYRDPDAGKVLFGDLGKRYLTSRMVDPNTDIRYEYVYRLHVEPTFGSRQVASIKPSQIAEWLADLGTRFGTSTLSTAFLVLQGILELAVADDALKKNPAHSKIVQVPKRVAEDIVPWTDERVLSLIDAHPAHLRAMPLLGASCGLREGEVFGLALEDVDFEDGLLRVRRQIKRLGRKFVFALPKNDRERVVPLPEWAAQTIRVHAAQYRPEPYTLPWEKPDGKPRTHNILFRWADNRHVRARLYSEAIWKPALAQLGIIPKPTKDARGRRRYQTTRREGTHQLRHYYASVMLADGVSIKELAEYLGHHDPAFTLRQYTHLLPSSHDRARHAIDARMFKPRAVGD